ncbi:carboxypeptidase-like regulatory domain-containing protein [Spirosoma foliorum]|uniref:Carboxypeptidase-like regulatory domain-containing protein n=1 Tax=Spirosoma foliorum TaxID=2710596 RepID=A0A7G5GVR7_9BACT|nr:carboxypeptidase-like regulatory domain-containing protein [Spirosoma foliorum]QMW02959.1 carboxypeptidase-like regulatory domain-containing protein [Spirosoma foliorum]
MKRIQLTVDTPCQQRWQDMAPIETGRFCDSCQKTVVDFSGMTDQQIVSNISQSASSTCGRFRVSQLDRTLQAPTPTAHSSGRFFSLLTAGLLGYQTVQADAHSTLARPSTLQTEQRPIATTDQPSTEVTTATDSSRVITGRIVDNVTKAGLGGATVIIKGTSRGANTDSTGHFQLRVPTDYLDKQITVVMAMIGFITTEVQIPPDRSEPLSIVLYEDQKLLGEVVVVGGYKKQTFFQRLRNRRRNSH